jgi:type IV secretion system protein VirB10
VSENPEGTPEGGAIPGSVRKESAEALELRARPRPVTRLNRKTLAVILAAFAIAVLIAAMVGLRRPKEHTSRPQSQTARPESVAHAAGLAAMPRSYAGLRAVPRLGAPAGEFGPAVVQEERAAGIPELPERPSFLPSPEEDAIRAERLRAEREAKQASKAKLFVHLGATPPTASAASNGSSAQSQSLAAAESIAAQVGHGLRGAGATAADRSAPERAQAQAVSFLHGSGTTQIYAAGRLVEPRSPNELLAGTVIPAALLTGIDSDLPGNIIATVTQNVYDTVTGRILLIPQGSRLLGVYDSKIAYGERRVLLVWTRLIFPDGASIVLGRLPGTDPQGYEGLEDRVDWHWKRLAAGAAVSTLLGATAELAVPGGQYGGSASALYASLEGLQGTMNQVGQEITQRNLDIQPTITIRPGYPLRVIVNKDLVLRPYPTRHSDSNP